MFALILVMIFVVFGFKIDNFVPYFVLAMAFVDGLISLMLDDTSKDGWKKFLQSSILNWHALRAYDSHIYF